MHLRKNIFTGCFIILFSIACNNNDDDAESLPLPSATFAYSFNEGEAFGGSTYQGTHPRNLSASLQLQALDTGGTKLTVTLYNTLAGESYATHAHNARDTTNGGNPYEFLVNTTILNQNPTGTGDSVQAVHYTPREFKFLVNEYQGYLVIHDPLQPINTNDPTTLLILGKFARPAR